MKVQELRKLLDIYDDDDEIEIEIYVHISVERCTDFASSGVTVSDQRCALFGSAVSL